MAKVELTKTTTAACPVPATNNAAIYVDNNVLKVKDETNTVVVTASGVNTGDETLTTLGATVGGAVEKAAIIGADKIAIVDSVTGHVTFITLTDLKAILRTYFDCIYVAQ